MFDINEKIITIEALQRAWCRETAVDPTRWSEARPSTGQCAITALVIQDVLDGKLLRTTNFGESHYLNELPDGEIIDLTADQFDQREYGPLVERSREHVLSDLSTAARYKLLLHRFAAELEHLGEHYALLCEVSE